jgi:16S rRNA (uracil1498-N3)-methyltransferase
MPNHGQTPRTHRFFCPTLTTPPNTPESATQASVSDALCPLDRQESHHARNVLRLSVGTNIELFNGQGSLAQATIQTYQSAHALCRITDLHHHPPITPSITLASAVPKGPRADAMIAQLSQLGIDRFIPLQAEHSIATPRPAKLDRFAKSTIESAKQCRRLHLMHIDQPQSPHDACTQHDYDLKLIATPNAPAIPDLAQRLNASQNTLVMVGPEGGFSPDELATAQDAGCLNWTLAPYILRIETAATTATAILRYLASQP